MAAALIRLRSWEIPSAHLGSALKMIMFKLDRQHSHQNPIKSVAYPAPMESFLHLHNLLDNRNDQQDVADDAGTAFTNSLVRIW